MAVARVFGRGLLIAALAALIFDVAYNSSSGTRLSVTSLNDFWAWSHVRSLDLARSAASAHLPSFLWDPGLKTLLRLPIWLCAGLLGFALSRVGRHRRAAGPAKEGWARTIAKGASLAAGILIGAALMPVIFDLSHIPAVNTGLSKKTLGDLWSQWHVHSLHGLRAIVQSHAPSHS